MTERGATNVRFAVLLIAAYLSLALGEASQGPLVFSFQFVSSTQRDAFLGQPPFDISSNVTGESSIAFKCNASALYVRFGDEGRLRSWSDDYLLSRYGVSSRSVTPPTPPSGAVAISNAAAAATTLSTLAAGQVGPFSAAFYFDELFYYYTSSGDLTPWYSAGPSGNDFEARVAVALFSGAEAFDKRAYRTQILPLASRVAVVVRFWSDATLSNSPARNLQQVYNILSSQTSLESLRGQLPGCSEITLIDGLGVSPDDVPTFDQIADSGQDEYSDQKVGFLVALIVILVVGVAVLVGGHLYSMRRMEERDLSREYGGTT